MSYKNVSEEDIKQKYNHVPEKMVQGVQMMIEGLKEAYPHWNPDEEHLKQTPYRIANMYLELCRGLKEDPKRHLILAFEDTKYNGIVTQKDIPFTSLCAHHFAVFRGVAHVAYIANKKIVGLSKINRVVEEVAAQPQVQEHLTATIAQIIEEVLKPKGVMVVCEAAHDCIETRGVKSKGGLTLTSTVTGVFASNKDDCKGEFFKLLGR